ncbi:hypothetical protein BCR35DRAFT_300436 [Leucosporidium creatinivorum]|uniref:Phytanoyl-CoA dioxygenase family protein n=1 Tax=Leucosporidium creatinivorum TaxID=106004 RepID=A0A1Y2FYY8_9BASI|nr:hypothetical protein BCR35DRAFT_300436 [Leucosporidium creatinivorum]
MSLVTLSADSPIESILAIMRRDGGVIIKDFMSQAEVEQMNSAAQVQFDALKKKPDPAKLAELGADFYASNTTHIRGMLAKMPEETSKIMLHPLWHAIMSETLKTTTQAWLGDKLLTTESGYVLSLASAYHVAPGAQAQVLHRDHSIHCPPAQENSLYTTQVGCLVAGTNSTEKNGATRVIPGSHLWGIDKRPLPELTIPAVMEAGSALFWLGSLYHGAGANTCTPGEPDDVRILYGVFACSDFARPEEAIHLIVPSSLAKTWPKEVLERAGWAKGAGGTGNVHTAHPYERWEDMVC